MRFFSYKDRPVHLGPFPLENLARTESIDLSSVPPMTALQFKDENNRDNLNNALAPYAAMLDAIRDGLVKKERAVIPQDPAERSNHLKAFGYYHDASMVGVCELQPDMFLEQSIKNPGVDSLADDLSNKQTKTLAAGIDVVMAELRETMQASPQSVKHHTHALVFLYQYPRDPNPDEPGTEWFRDTQAQRACVRAGETNTVISNYIRLLGYEARGHSATCSDLDINRAVVAAGLGEVLNASEGGVISNPFLGTRFGVGVITTTLSLAADKPLKPSSESGVMERFKSHGPSWWLGKGFEKNAINAVPFKRRQFKDGQFPFERIKRVDETTTFIDELRVPRVPKRTDMFARAIFGDMGEQVQEGAKNGNYVRKSPTSYGPRRLLGALVLMQDGPVAAEISPTAKDPQRNADNIHAALFYLGADAVGISRCPDWAYYSHDAVGDEIEPYHSNAISVIIDQGHETMEGASGDDWIACSQSMRAYLRFSLLGGIIAEQIRRIGYSARTHSVMDGEVLQPPLLLLSGLGEVSRIGEVILNPYLGPRLKSGVITTNMPLAHSKPIDFGLQKFCESCNKCARECPAGAITAGPKTMFNGYEIYKSDSQKCTSYRINQKGGAMCGRCMKTCPWNLEGVFAEAPFRWAAMKLPRMAKPLAKLDDALGNGEVNEVKKWWWDLEMIDDGPFLPATAEVNKRTLQKDLDLKFEDQTLAVYPANLAPPPYPFPFPMDREKGIQAYKDMLTPAQYKERLAAGETDAVAHIYPHTDLSNAPVMRVNIASAEKQTDTITKYTLNSVDGSPLPVFTAGAHVDVVVAPEFFRQYSLLSNPADTSEYEIAVLKEETGRGGSNLLHRIFTTGRKIFISKPINHFPLDEAATKSILMGGGIGVTPLLAMAHSLHETGKDFTLHYSCQSRADAALMKDIENAPWADNVVTHFSDEGSRANFDEILNGPKNTWHIYTCGADRYMSAVIGAAEKNGWREENIHKEYFSVPDVPEYENHAFQLKLTRTEKTVDVSAEQSASDALAAAGVHVDIKCSDGLCGVCKCGYSSGEVEHRDFVLSNAQRENTLILCQSRAADKDGVIEIDL